MNNSISFLGMGCIAKDTDVGNYRIRSNFKDNDSNDCFIEIAHFYKNDKLYGMVRDAYRVSDGEEKRHLFISFDDMYKSICEYNLKDIITKVNHLFNCNFVNANVIKY